MKVGFYSFKIRQAGHFRKGVRLGQVIVKCQREYLFFPVFRLCRNGHFRTWYGKQRFFAHGGKITLPDFNGTVSGQQVIFVGIRNTGQDKHYKNQAKTNGCKFDCFIHRIRLLSRDFYGSGLLGGGLLSSGLFGGGLFSGGLLGSGLLGSGLLGGGLFSGGLLGGGLFSSGLLGSDFQSIHTIRVKQQFSYFPVVFIIIGKNKRRSCKIIGSLSEISRAEFFSGRSCFEFFK